MVSEENRTRQSGAWETAATDPQETFGWLRSDVAVHGSLDTEPECSAAQRLRQKFRVHLTVI